MKWIKTAIGAVIAISVIPLVVLSVINIKKSLETEKITITFETDCSQVLYDRYVFHHTLHYDDLIDYVEKGYTITNLYDYTNDITITISNWNLEYGVGIADDTLTMDDNNSVVYFFNLDDGDLFIPFSYNSIYNANAPDIVLMDIILSKSNVNLAAALLAFVPLVFVGGVLLYFYKPFKKD